LKGTAPSKAAVTERRALVTAAERVRSARVDMLACALFLPREP